MLKQKEYKSIMEQFRNNNMQSYEVWFEENVNCEIKDLTSKKEKWIKGIQLQSNAKNYAVIAVEWGIVFHVRFEDFRTIQ